MVVVFDDHHHRAASDFWLFKSSPCARECTQHQHPVVEYTALVPKCFVLATLRERQVCATPAWSTLRQRQVYAHHRHSVVNSLRLRQECTHHQYSVDKHTPPWSTLRRSLQCKQRPAPLGRNGRCAEMSVRRLRGEQHDVGSSGKS